MVRNDFGRRPILFNNENGTLTLPMNVLLLRMDRLPRPGIKTELAGKMIKVVVILEYEVAVVLKFGNARGD